MSEVPDGCHPNEGKFEKICGKEGEEMKGSPITSGFFDTFQEGEKWIEKQEKRENYKVLSSGCNLHFNGKYRAYVYGFAFITFDSLFSKTRKMKK